MFRSIIFIVATLVCYTNAAGTPPPPCIEAFRAFAFSDCNEYGERTAFEYWNQSCTPSALVLNEPRTAPCEMECPSGTFYSARFIGCERCAFGEYSYTGDIISNFSPWPVNLVTYCTPQPCSPWVPSGLGSFISSGNNSIRFNNDGTVLRWVSSSVVLVVNAVKYGGGRVTFQYRVESESGFDGLAVYLNNTRMKFADFGNFLASGLQFEWKTYDILLPQGTTEIRWSYEKATAKTSYDTGRVGRDRAYLGNIRIDGSVLERETCSQCPGGYKAVPTADRCELCPAGTYAPPGSSKCTTCPTNTYSAAGAAACSTKIRCEASDYIIQYSACDAGYNTRSLTYKINNPNCVPSSVTTPSPVLGVQCAPCMVGKYLQATCVPCPPGQYYSGSCQDCNGGNAAVPSLTFPDFDVLDGQLINGGFTTSCKGACPKTGPWDVYPTRADGNTVVGLYSGVLGASAISVLGLHSNLITTGYIKFRYYFAHRGPHPGDHVSATFYVKNQVYFLDINTYDSSDNAGEFKSDLLPAGSYDFSWEFMKDFVDDQVALVIQSLEVFGDDNGGTSTCIECFAGHSCSANSNVMTPCAPGTYSDGTSGVCTPCAGNTIAPNAGSKSCTACPDGSVATNGTSCVYSCKFKGDGFSYDLSPIKSKKYGPLFRGDVMADIVADALLVERFYVKLCDFVQDNSCGADSNSFVCSRFNANKTLKLGTAATFKTNKYSGVTATYSGGSPCESLSGSRTTVINLLCDLDSSNVDGKIRWAGEYPTCQYNFEILT
eukprot:PhF_6_TR10061/c2_g2_i1/m.15564